MNDTINGADTSKEIKDEIIALGLNPKNTDYIPNIGMIRNKYYIGFVFGTTKGGMFERIKKMIEYKKDSIAKALKENDLESYVFYHERPYRLEALIEGLKKIKTSKKNKALALASVWIDSETPSINYWTWVGLFEKYGRLSMSKENQEAFDSLPDKVEVYRGTTEKYDNGLSWTLNEDIAEFFATRFEEYGEVISKVVDKEDIVAYYGDRDEQEVIII
jgi:hypothetical protein